MLNIKDFRSVYPEYDNLTDYELSTALHRTHYADMPYEQFAQNFGGPLQEDKVELAVRDYNAANPDHPITAQDIRDKDRSGLWGGIRLLGEGIYDAVSDQFPEDLARAWRAGEIDPNDPGIADRIIQRQMKDSAARVPSLQEVEGDTLANSLYQGPKSIATSVATGITGSALGGAAGGLAGSVVPGVGTAAGGLAGSLLGGSTMSGVAFYRMAKDQFVDEVQQAMQASMGRTLTSEEAAELNKAIDADATEFGYWEAVPEAASQFFTLGLIKGGAGKVLKKLGLGKMADAIGKRALTRIPAKIGAELGEEETTEGLTYIGQEGIRQRYDLRPDAPSLGEFIEEQAGPVAVGSLLQLGGMRAAESIGRRMRRRAGDVNANAEQNEETATSSASPETQWLSEHDVSAAAPYVFEQSPENMPVPVSPGEFISEADMADIDAFVRDYEAREQAQADASMLSEYGRPEARRFTPLQSALEAGKTIDLLSLPSGAAGVAQGIGGLALPSGTGAIPMGTDASSREPIAPPTDFSGTPLVTPFTPRPALAQQAGPSAGQGRWAGGRSQLAYGGGMMQGLGFMDAGQAGPRAAAQVPAMPTQAQITGIQQAPRADTMASAEALGMPAPEARPVEARPTPAPQSSMPVTTPAATPQVEPKWSYSLPSFVTAPYGRAGSKTARTSSVAPQVEKNTGPRHESRAELLQQLSPESRKEARRLTNAQIRERVRAERNPVKFDRDAIDYTVEDYPMPTAPSGTAFTSASGRRMAPFPQVDYSTPRKHKASNAKVAAWLLDEARKEAAPNEWRSLMIRGMRADNLSPADVRELVDILSNGVEKEVIPPLLKPLPAETEPTNDAKKEPGKEDGKEAAAGATQAEQKKERDISELQIAASEAQGRKIAESDASEESDNVVKEDKTTREVSDGQDSVRNELAPLRQPVVDEQAAVALGERPEASAGTVEQSEPRGIEEPSRLHGGKRRKTDVSDGKHAGRHSAGTDSSGILSNDGLPGRGTSRRTSNRDSELGGEGAQGGSRDGRRARGDGRRVGDESQPFAKGPVNQNNHRIADDDIIVPGGSVARAKANIAAIRLVKKLDEENRPATLEEKKILTQFTGWGSLAQTVFNPEHVRTARSEVQVRERGWNYSPLGHLSQADREKYAKWKSQYGEALMPELGGLLTEKEWASAEKSTLNAHYTDRNVISSMWKMAEHLGFRGGRILEPSAGTGLFFGLMPEEISQKSSLVGVELDEVTGKILKYLYPDADIQITGFEKSKRLGDNSVDLVISNVPFGDFQVFDKIRPQYSKQSIHNYFFSRAIDTVRPGGLVMQITSHFTLDSGSAARLREEWGRKADLVAAVRLPGTAFEKNAGTEVTTDIIVLRKKSDSDFFLGQPFRNLAAVETRQGETQVNEYFVAHPEMVLGEHSLSGSMYGSNEYTLLPKKNESLQDGLNRIVENLPADVYGVDAASAPVADHSGKEAQEGAKEGSLVEDGGSVYVVADGRLEKPEWAEKPHQVEQAKAYIGVKDTALQLISAMNVDDGNDRVIGLQKNLNEKYDAYVKKFGPINKFGNKFLEDDIEFPTMAALEHVTEITVQKTVKSGPQKGTIQPAKERQISKADIFSKRTIFPFHAPVHADSVEDAIKISRIYKNKIDLPYIASLLGMDTEQARKALLETVEVFENPESGLLEPRDVYLSGNVREKLHRAEAAAEENPAYTNNVAALREVQPERIGIDSIYVTIGSSWLPPHVYEGFLKHIGVRAVKITRTRLPGDEGGTTWDVQGTGFSADAKNKWGTERALVTDIVEDCLNLKRVVVMDTFREGGKTRSVRNDAETMAAQEKQRLLQEEFSRWVKGSEFVQEIEDIYNETFNGSVVRHFDVPDIKHYPGASHSIELRDNQKRGVSRALQESCLLAHGVGSGKTMLQITLAMEMRRLGTAKKPWIVVQGATLAQFAASFKALYPGARILAPTEEQRNAKNRRRLLARIASGDWDAVITPHGFFNGVSVSPETETRFISEQISEYEDMLEGMDKEQRITRKQIEKKIERLKLRLEKLADTRKDENIYFDDLGIDALIIDEAHAYKRGQFVTKMDNVKGLDRDSSQRSMQLLMKARMVQAKTGGKNVVLATGTPISNTLTEMWTMFRYTRPDLLKQFGVEQFDDFATTFAATSVTQEETATGEWKDVERFNKYVNGPELLTLWRLGADVAITEDLTSIKNMPKLKGGKIHEVAVERSGALSNYIEALRQERIAWDRLTGKEKREKSYVPLTIYGRAKQAAIDLRLVDSTLEDEPNSKANTAVRNIFERWEKYKDSSATLFSDTFQSRDKSFNLFKDIKSKLIQRGIPAKEIAIIHDYKTDEARKKLFDSVVEGEVRVLMGTTEKLGVGVNVQDRLVAAHHLDAPQRPMDFEQRNGRIRRPGNMFQEVEILTYGTKNTLDSVTFQQLISKQKFINQLLRGNVSDRSFENPFDATQATFEDMMAAFSGNPLAKEKMQLTAEVRRLKAQLASHNSQISNQRSKLRSMRARLEQQRGLLPTERAITDFVKRNYPDGAIEDRKELTKQFNEWLVPATKEILDAISVIKSEAQWYVKDKKAYNRSTSIEIGNGVSIDISLFPKIRFSDEETEHTVISEYVLKGPHGIKETDRFNGAQGLFSRISNVLAQLQNREMYAKARIKDTEAQIESLEREVERPFPQREELDAAEQRLAEVEKELQATTKVEEEREQTEDEEPLASILPGQYLPRDRKTRLTLPVAAVRRVADSLGKMAKNAAPVRVVRRFEELPESIRKKYAGNASVLEGVYDPRSRVVWLVADNLSDTGRAAEVWAHEQVVHHGLRGLLGKAEKRRVLNRLWQSMGGMGNAKIASVANKYGVDPRSDAESRELVMEEVVAHLAEKRATDKLTGQDKKYWRRFVDAVLRAWHALVNAVTGRRGSMKYENVDRLLSALERYVFEGRPEGMAEGGMVPAMASKRSDPNNARFSPNTGKKTDFVTLPDGSVDFAQFPATRLKDMRLLRAAPIRLPRGIHSLSGGYGLTHIEANHGDEIRAAGYGSVQEFVWDLVNGYNEIWEGEKRSLLILKNNGKTSRPAGFIELEKDGSHYIVKNAYPVDMNYPTAATRKQLWKSAPPSSSTSGEQTPSNPFTPGIPSKDQTGNLQGQRGQSSEENIQQGGDGGKPLASMGEDMDAAGHAAWEQLQRDLEEWARQVDAFDPAPSRGADKRRLLSVCRTPDVLRKLGAPDLPMTMTARNLEKVLSDKQDHQLPKDLVKQLPKALAEPVMVFESATEANSFVVLTELTHEGRSVMVAVHLDTERQNIRVNDIASAYKRGNEGWYIRQIEDGRLLYQDKKKSLAWARTKGLQLPRVRKLPSRLSEKRILTDADIVKPVESPLTQEDDAPLASLSPRDILGMTVRRAAREAGEPEIRHLFKGDDLTMLQSIVQLPHWIAKQAPAFAKVYERQLRRMDERSAALKKSLETVPSMFGKDRLKAADMDSLRKLLWEHEGKEAKALEGVEKFLTKETLATGRELIKVNPDFYSAYQGWLDGLHGTKAAKAAMLEIRKSLDADLVLAHNRMASMSEMSDDAIKEFRQSIGHVPNYFPHHRYGAYFVQAKVGSNVVFRQHFDAFGEKAAMAKARKIVEKQRKNYPDAEWSDGKNDRLPDEVLGAPIDSEAMEQIIRAATAKIGDKERAREINELLAEGVSDVLKARGWGSHGIQRKGIPGFETEDIARVLYDYKAGLNGWLTKMEAARDFSEALSNIDARQTPNLWKYTSQYVRDMLRNSDRVDRITGNIKTIAFAWYLGGSIKTALVNATQNLVVGVPRLQMDVMGGGREWLSGAQSALVDRMTGNRGKGLTDEEARLVQELYGESVITDAFMEEVRGQLRGISGATLWNKFTKVLGLPMSEVERFNRASLALAAFRAARGGKLKAKAREKYGVKGKASYEQAKAFASDVVRDAHFVYGKSNMPEFMRSNTAGRAMSSMYTFRTFTHNMVAMWIWALKTQGKEGAAFVAKSLGATMALGGVTALPLYATLMTLFQAVTGDDDDWTELIRSLLPESNLLRDVVCYGVPAIAGVNIGGSLQMETPLTKGLAGGKTPQEVLTDSIGDIIGIPYDLLVVKPSRVMEAHSKGNTWRMLEEAAPVAVKNGMQAWRLYSEGQTTMTGRPINDPGEKGARRLSSGESFGKLLGFQPVSSTKSYAAYAATRHADQVRSDKIDELTVLMLKTYDTGDLAGRREANRKLREWNEKMKAEGKPHMLIKLKDVLRRVKSRRRENRVTPKAIQKREWQQAVWG